MLLSPLCRSGLVYTCRKPSLDHEPEMSRHHTVRIVPFLPLVRRSLAGTPVAVPVHPGTRSQGRTRCSRPHLRNYQPHMCHARTLLAMARYFRVGTSFLVGKSYNGLRRSHLGTSPHRMWSTASCSHSAHSCLRCSWSDGWRLRRKRRQVDRRRSRTGRRRWWRLKRSPQRMAGGWRSPQGSNDQRGT